MQIALNFDNKLDYSKENFFISESNEKAYLMVDAWPEWESQFLLLCGSGSCGKTHLSHIWQEKSEAIFVDLNSEITGFSAQNYICENIDLLANDNLAQERLFHLYNHVRNEGGYLLLTSSQALNDLNFATADLTSRIKSMVCSVINEPDEILLLTILSKSFSDRQLKVSKEVLEYIIPRIERSFSFIQKLVDHIDKKSLSEGRKITIPFVRELLESAR